MELSVHGGVIEVKLKSFAGPRRMQPWFLRRLSEIPLPEGNTRDGSMRGSRERDIECQV